MTGNVPMQTPELALCIDGLPQVLPVNDLADASQKWQAIRSFYCLHPDDVGKVEVIDVDTAAVVARISYNGRVWGTDDKEIVINGRKTAAQHEVEGWADFKTGPAWKGQKQCAS